MKIQKKTGEIRVLSKVVIVDHFSPGFLFRI